MLDKAEVDAVFQQIYFFNEQFHASKDKEQLKDFHNLMRTSKDRCQLMLLKFASPEWIWVRSDPESAGGEWLIGAVHSPEKSAAHIPLHTLQQGLSAEQLQTWQIG